MSVTIEADAPAVESVPSETTETAAPAAKNDRWKTLLKYVGSLFDQSLVSGTRFATSILIGAVCGAAELGLYAIGFSILMALHSMQLSLICRPFTIYGNQMSADERRQLGGSVLVQFFGFGLLASIGLAATAGTMIGLGLATSLPSVLLILAVGTPFILLREHARQFCFARLQVKSVTLIDFTATVIQFAGLGGLAWTGQLSAVTALATTTVSAGLGGLLWLWMARTELQVELARVLRDLKSQWRIGKWDCASEMAFALQIYGMTWLLAAMLDNTRVGIYAACMMSIQILNPFLLGVNSLLVPKTARAYASAGATGLHHFVRQTTIILGSLTAMFALVAAIWGPSALELIYSGQGFEIPPLVVSLLVLGVVVEVMAIGPENGVWAMSRHDLNFRVQLCGCAVTALSAFPLIAMMGLAGAATSFLLGRLATTGIQWVAYSMATRQPASSPLTES